MPCGRGSGVRVGARRITVLEVPPKLAEAEEHRHARAPAERVHRTPEERGGRQVEAPGGRVAGRREERRCGVDDAAGDRERRPRTEHLAQHEGEAPRADVTFRLGPELSLVDSVLQVTSVVGLTPQLSCKVWGGRREDAD